MSDERILARLPELPVMHISLEVSNAELARKLPRLIHAVRIMGCLPISVMPESQGGVTEQGFADALAVLDAANELRNPSLSSCRLVLVYYPWSQTQSPCTFPNAYTGTGPYLDCDCNNTAGCPDDPRQTCHDDAAVEEYEDRIDVILGYLDDAGRDASLIAWQVFNTERWAAIPGIPLWNSALTAKYDRFYDAAKAKLPDVPIHHYERAGRTWVDHPTTHLFSQVDSPLYTLDEKGDAVSVSLYNVHEFKRTKKTLEATVDRAIAIAPEGESPIIVSPWVGLACAFPELGTGVPFDGDHDHGVRHIRDVAKLLRHFDPGNARVTIDPIALYPPPFTLWTPRWMRYFIEYDRAFTE